LRDLVHQLETGSPNPPDRHPDLELVAKHRLRSVVALRARDDHTRERIRLPRQLAPACQATLLEVGEVHRMIDVPHGVAVPKADRHAMAISELRHARYNNATVALPASISETFTADETRALDPFFTNTDRPVFALRNLPETVKGALFARYSRSAKSVR